MQKQNKQRLEQLVRQGLVPSRKLPILMTAMSSLHMGKQLTPTERDILAKYMHNMTDIMLKDDTVFNRTKLHTQRTKYQTEETTVDLDEKMVDGVEVVDGPEAEEKMKSKKAKKKDDIDDMKESREGDEEERMRKKEENKARRLSIRKRDKFRMLPTELKKEKMKAGVEEEVINFNDMYKEQFEAALEYYGIDNIRDLPEESKAEFFKLVDLALEEAKMAKKDHDGDGKIETSTAEYMGSRDKAIKKAMKKEEVEQVDELKKSTLSSYIQKAADPAGKKSNVNLASKGAHKLATSDEDNAGEKEDKKAFVRSRGIQTAAKKLAKEEVEVEEEYTNSDFLKVSKRVKVKSTGATGEVVGRYRHDNGDIHFTVKHGDTTSRHPGSNLKVHKEEVEIEEDMQVKQAIGIASDKRYKGGNMTGAVNAIEKMRKGLSDHPQVKAVLKRQNEETERLDEYGNPASKPAMSDDDKLAMIRRAAERVKSGEAARDREKRAERAAKADMRQKGAQKGMAPTKKDVEEQVKAIRKTIKEGSAKEKIEAYKELNTIIEQFKSTGEL